MNVVFGLIVDCGDGSSSLLWYSNPETVEKLLEFDESFYANESSPAVTLTIPEGVTAEQLGISVDNSAPEDVNADDY